MGREFIRELFKQAEEHSVSNPSPLVRRIRLGLEIEQLRTEHGWNQDELGKASGIGRVNVGRMETAKVAPNLDAVLDVLAALGIERGSTKWDELFELARESRKPGWWARRPYSAMGARQRRWANVELGAESIRAYDPFLIHGLLQVEQYYTALNETVAKEEEFNAGAEVAGRMERQRQLADSGTRLDVLLDEQAVRRLYVPVETMRAQLQHLAKIATSKRISVRVIPTIADLAGVRPPRSPFVLFEYPDPSDPALAVLEGVEDDDTFTDHRVDWYVRLFERLGSAALSAKGSAEYFAKAAKELGG